ncbi:hypothetical protein D3C84_1317270 [compost metagenome]
MESEIAALKAQLAQHEVRMDVSEAGLDWKTEAVCLKADGLNAGEIARRLGQKYATVRQHLHRHSKA